MKTIEYKVEELTCPSCIKKIESALSKQNGVHEVLVKFHASKVKVTIDPSITDEVKVGLMLNQLGYRVLSKKTV